MLEVFNPLLVRFEMTMFFCLSVCLVWLTFVTNFSLTVLHHWMSAFLCLVVLSI